MKKIITLITLIFVSYIATYAETPNDIHSQITKQIKMPATLKSQKLNAIVNVEFTILENGTVSILNVSTNNQELRQNIISQFNQMNFKNVAFQKGQTYFIDIKFKVL